MLRPRKSHSCITFHCYMTQWKTPTERKGLHLIKRERREPNSMKIYSPHSKCFRGKVEYHPLVTNSCTTLFSTSIRYKLKRKGFSKIIRAEGRNTRQKYFIYLTSVFLKIERAYSPMIIMSSA